MKKTTLPTIFCLFLAFTISFAQNNKIKKANSLYNDLAYIDATKIYLKVVESGFKSEEILEKLANTYYFNANYTEAIKWYKELFLLSEDINSIYYLRYSQCLNAIGNIELAEDLYNKYLSKENLLENEFNNAEEYLKIIENSERYTINNLPINTEGIDFGSGFKDKNTYNFQNLVYTSTKPLHGKKIKTNDDWSGLSFLNLFETNLNENGSLGVSHPLEGDINTKKHESSAIFTKDGKTMYFTRTNDSPKFKKNKKERLHLKIYRAHLVDGVWTNIEDLSINGDNYSNAHPALSPSENVLYFASDMPQSIGQTDIFAAKINKDGTIGKPYNLGEKVNTKGRESFPFISSDNELYFSSDGHFGLGGYDVFYLKIKGSGFTGGLINVGKPINSPFDDFAFIIDNHKGFVSSNRPGGKGLDDIYSFVETKDIKELLNRRIYGTVLDAVTMQPLQNATVTVFDPNGEVANTLQTDAIGFYQVEVERAKAYLLKATKPEYNGDDAYSDKYSVEQEINFLLTRNQTIVKEGDDIAKILDVKIYFDFDKSFIREDAKIQLEKIIAVLNENPSMKIDVRSHTDSRAPDAYNLKLSQRRNVSTVQYLIDRGINPSRLTGKGYGETQLVNNCTNGVECSEEMHQLNRRSEFIIIK